MKCFLTSILALAATFTVSAQDKNGVIMTIDGEDIPTEEFLYLFNKNNQQQPKPQTLDEYLPLFETYRLKVAEAKSLGIDTTRNFIKEMEVYRRDLLEPYIADSVFFNNLVDIAAQREQTQVESSHIMIIRTNNPEKDSRNLEILDSLRTELLNGADFIEIAKVYSQDKFSSAKGGYLGFSPAGTYPYGFETAVYETPEGEISEIVESHVGWHIVKSGARRPAVSFDRPAKSREEIRNEVNRKSSSPFDTRYHQIRANVVKNLKEKHPEVKTEGLNDDEAYNVLLAAEEDVQYKNNPDYKNLVDEYVNGSLLYEVSVDNVWNKAANDTEGLQAYYDKHKAQYKWENPHAKGILVQALNDSVAEVVKNQIAGLDRDKIVTHIKENFKKEAAAENFNVARGVNSVIDNLMFGVTEENPLPEKGVFFVVEGKVLDSPEGLDDVKSLVISDYQEELEGAWVDTLRQKHSVVVNQPELERLKTYVQ